MAENKKSVLLYCDIIHTIKSLTDDEAGKLFKHYLEYINDLNPKADRLTELLFEPIKQNLKRDLKKWEGKSERNSLIAKEGWKKRKDANAYEGIKHDANAYEGIKHDAKDADKVTVTVTDKDILYKGNFFYIGLERYNTPISAYVKIEHQQTLEVWQMQNKDIPIEKVFEAMDKECIGKHFTDDEHTINSFKWTYRDLKKGLKQFTPEQKPIKASSNYGRK